MIRRSIALPFVFFTLGAAALACGDDDDDVSVAPPTGDGGLPDAPVPDATGGAPVVAATTLPDLVAGVAAAPVTFTATGTGPITWSVSAGALPAGMTLDAATGTYAGTPTASGSFSFTVTATNALGAGNLPVTQNVGAPAVDAYALVGSGIAGFNTGLPALAGAPVPLFGAVAGDVIVAMDQRPMNGFLYGVGHNSAANTIRIYSIDPVSGFVSPLGTDPIAVTAGTTVVGFDFNPTADRIRIVTGAGQNLRLNPNNGTLAATDTPLNGEATSATEVAYTNSAQTPSFTTLYTADAAAKKLFLQNPPNGGTLTAGVAITPDIDAILGFDIAEGVNVTANNAAVAAGRGHMGVKLAGQTAESFASIDLVTGQLGVIGTFPFTGTRSIALTKASSRPIVGLTTAGLVRFTEAGAATPSAPVAVAPFAGETIVGIDFRPATGQLYAVGINATANTGTLYLVDPAAGTLTVVGNGGLPGGIAFVDAALAPIDFPADATWGVDFNPAADRVRVVNSAGQNFRIQPVTGVGVDFGAANGTNPDANLNGGTTKLDAVAYTNGPPAAGVSPPPTAEYGLDSSTNALYLVQDPNNGVTGPAIPVTVGGAPLDFTGVSGFDIPRSVTTPAANQAVTSGFALAALVVGGATNLYRVDLVTGAATLVSAIGNGTTQLVGLAIGN